MESNFKYSKTLYSMINQETGGNWEMQLLSSMYLRQIKCNFNICLQSAENSAL